MKYLFILLSFFTVSCANHINLAQEKNLKLTGKPKEDSLRLLPASYFGNDAEIIDVKNIYRLTKAQEEKFITYARTYQSAGVAANRVISNYLETRLSEFNYYADTFTASESLEGNQGNCLSLAILTKSLADLLQVEMSFDLVETDPVFQKEGNIVITSQHVRTNLLNSSEKKANKGLLFRGRIIIDYFPIGGSRRLRKVDISEFKAMYYDNKAAESLVLNDINRAYRYTLKSLELKPKGPIALNMAALIHEKMGQLAYSEDIYLYGLRYSEDKLTLLNNYHSVLVRQNRMDEAKKIAKELAKYPNVNPFSWISLANASYNKKNYAKAFSFYRKASELAPYLHEPFAGMARSEFMQNNIKGASRYISIAMDRANKKSDRDIYHLKYKMLNKLSH